MKRLLPGLAAILLGLGLYAQTPAGSDRLFRDADGIFDDAFDAKMEQQLRDFDKLGPGRIVVLALKDSPPDGEDAFIAGTTSRLQSSDPKLADGLIFFYFRENHRAHTESGPTLASRLSNSDIQKILQWSMAAPGADVTYPAALEKALTSISFAIRDADARPRPGAGIIGRAGSAARHWYFVYRGSELGSGNWLAAPIIVLVLLLLAVGIIVGQVRMVSRTIASGKKQHLSRGRIAAEVAGQFAVEGVEVAANVALTALSSGGGGGSEGGGFSGGGGSFGGGGASGSW